MKTAPKTIRNLPARRRFLGLLVGMSAVGLALPLRARRPVPEALSLKEADFYRPHDLAG
jgi:hypothetical protein